MSERFAAIPSRLERDTVWPLIDALRAANVTPVIVHTKADSEPVPDAVNLDGSDQLNFQYWCNLGLKYASSRGADYGLAINDDLLPSTSDLNTMFDALETHDLVWPVHPDGLHAPFAGWCFGLRPDVILMDEAFTWWHGDDDLYWRAYTRGLRLAPLDIAPAHVRVKNYENWDQTVFADVIPRDQALFYDRWPGK